MKKYFVQTKYPDGTVELSVRTATQIIELFGFSDCSDCQYEVFDGSTFGSSVRLVYEAATHAPFNFHLFINSETREVEFEGYSKEH